MTVTDNDQSITVEVDLDDQAPADTTPRPAGWTPLPDGAWAIIRDPKTVKQRDRKAVLSAIDQANAAGLGTVMQMVESGNATMVLAITDWSYAHADIPSEVRLDNGQPLPPPSQRPDILDELPIPVYDALQEAIKAFSDVVFPSFNGDPADVNREGPTGPSSD